MRIKSFFSSSVDAALCEARRELGPEAMLIESRRSAPESRRLGEYEVVCAVTAPPAARGRSSNDTPSGPAPAPGFPTQDFAALVERVERLSLVLQRAESSALRLTLNPELAAASRLLESTELDPRWIGSIVSSIENSPCAGAAGSELHDQIQNRLTGLVSVDPTLGVPSAARRIIALIGPPGAGKTTSLVKLAARFALSGARPSLILSADTQRVAATEQLRAFAAILGSAFVAVDSPRVLRQALEEHGGKEWIWIDTPGWSRDEPSDAKGLAELISSVPDLDTHLVLPASMRAADLSATVDRFLPFHPAKLLFTRLDETSCFGPLLNESARTGIPLSFLGNGPQIPEDIEPAEPAAVARLILRHQLGIRRAASAAA